jgi:hypothetical protein
LSKGAASTGGGAKASQNRQSWVRGILKPGRNSRSEIAKAFKTIQGDIRIAPASRQAAYSGKGHNLQQPSFGEFPLLLKELYVNK